MAVGPPKAIRDKREAIVLEHMESENRHEFDVTLGTFDHPRYELIATGDVHDGPKEVDGLLRGDPQGVSRPAQRADRAASRRRRGDRRGDALRNPPEGPLRGLPPTGRSFEMQFCALFLFEEDRLVCERVYFDAGTILRQLGIAHDPLTLRGRVATLFNHPVTIGQAMVRRLARR